MNATTTKLSTSEKPSSLAKLSNELMSASLPTTREVRKRCASVTGLHAFFATGAVRRAKRIEREERIAKQVGFVADETSSARDKMQAEKLKRKREERARRAAKARREAERRAAGREEERQNHSGGGCFAGDGQVVMAVSSATVNTNLTKRVDEVRPGDTIWSPALNQPVTVVATTKSHENKICNVNGLRISRKHPIKLPPSESAVTGWAGEKWSEARWSDSEWLAPQDVTAPQGGSGVIELSTPMTVHNFVLSEGASMCVNGMGVITLGGPRPDNDHPNVHSLYYDTQRVVDDLKQLPSWPECEWYY